jgi:hypothetical protein
MSASGSSRFQQFLQNRCRIPAEGRAFLPNKAFLFDPSFPLFGAPFNAQKFIACQSVMFLSEGLEKRDDFGMCTFPGRPFIRILEGMGQDLHRPRDKPTDLPRRPDAAPG